MKRTPVHFKFILTGLFLLFMAKELKAQFQQLPVDNSLKVQVVSPNEHLRIKAVPLSLPFWDDFSSGEIDSLKWENKGVVPSKTVGINPPSMGVVYLDGVDIKGNPYSTSMLENGEGDYLASRDINLSAYSGSDSLYLSFFWQAGGKGEMPDENDILELYFMDESGEYTLVWEVSGGDIAAREIFTQEMVKVDPAFFHGNFRFKFLNKGRLSGPFDSWILDYVYLNRDRNVFDIYHEDRALTKYPNSPFGKFNAIPLFEWDNHKAQYLTSISSQFNNLSNRFRAMEYSILLRDKNSQRLLQTIHAQSPFNPVPQALERRDFSSIAIKELDLEVSEEFDLETVVYLTTGDGLLVQEISGRDTLFSDEVDYRINDTVSHTLPIRDFMAYDNGSVDYAAGINQRSGMLALRYELETGAYLKGISINFPNLSQVGSGLELMVWEDLEAPAIYTGEVLIPSKEELGEFSYFPLDTNLIVSGTFYIGFTQFTNDFVYVGLDKSNDAGEEVFFNVTGSWEQNEEVVGSLMIRPHLSLEPVVAEGERDSIGGINVYPNPVTEKLFLEGKITDLKVFDAYGRQINMKVEQFEKGKILNFTGSDKGVYILRAWIGDKPNSIRILVK